MSDPGDIQSLLKIFDQCRHNDDSNSEDEYTGNPDQEIPTARRRGNKTSKTYPYEKLGAKELLEEEKELLKGDFVNEDPEPCCDWKKTPSWDISYKQRVSASDVFLQMGNKSPSTASCEDMVIAILLPGEQMQNINIKILKDKLEVVSPNFALKVPLPQPVDPQKGDAKWDKDQEKLIITLKMDREFDFINF